MLREISFLVFLVHILSATTTNSSDNTTETPQIPSPANNVSTTESATITQEVITKLKGASEIFLKDLDSEESNGVLHPIDQIRHLNTPITFETRRSVSNGSLEAESLAEVLAQHRCVPTAVARGPCHSCVCSKHGAYFCREQDCSFVDNEQFSSGDQPECEKNMLYNEGSLWCNCNAYGLWRSSNCRQNFRYIRNKKSVRTHPDLPTNYSCKKGSYYAVDCNICECKTGVLSIASCTNRTCVPGHRADECKLGQVLRHPNEICACSAIGYYVDKLCVTFDSNETIQILSKEQLATLTYEEQSVVIETTGNKDRCRPNTVIHRDCNRCRCTESSELVCTNKLCLDFHTGNSLRTKIEQYKKTERLGSKMSNLPELKSPQQTCVPGKQYRYKCNMCMCSKKGIPSCTTMICLDDFENIKRTKEQKFSKVKSEKKKLRQSDAPTLENDGNWSIDGTLLRGVLPFIKEGEVCLPGHVYRQDCNICRCSDANSLVCSKMLCVRPEDKPTKVPSKLLYSPSNLGHWQVRNIVKQNKKKKEAHGALRTDQKESIETKSQKPIKRKRSNSKGKSRAVKPSLKERNSGSNYPDLPTTKCQPGNIYQKGCQRCFCTERKIAQCTNRPCTEMTGPVRLPKDVYPRVPAKEFSRLPELPHQAAKCDIGRVYRIDCNICLCLHNGNLLCNNLLCLALNEVNRITANKLAGKPCSDDEFIDVDPLVDCVKCKCNKKGRSKCEPVDDCTPYRMRRSLHGELSPKVKPKMVLTEEDSSCTPGMVYKQNCNNCYCQEDGSLRCTRKGCLNYELVEKLKEQREKLLNEQKSSPPPKQSPIL